MAFHEVQFPDDISYGSIGGPGYSTSIVSTDSGAEERVARWSVPRRRYDAAYGVKSYANLVTVKDFYIARQGPAFGFRFKDHLDCTSSPGDGLFSGLGGTAPTKDDQNLGTGDGSQTTFQFVKTYTSGPTTRTRNITKPVNGTTLIAIDGVLQTVGFLVDFTTGILSFTVAPAAGELITAGFEFDVPVRFAEELDEVFNVAFDGFGSGSVEAIPMVELVDETIVEEEFFYGGSATATISATNFALSPINGRVQLFNVTAAGKRLELPNHTNLPTGGPYFYIENISTSTQSITVFDLQSATTVVTLAIGDTAIVLLGLTAASAKLWIVFQG